MSAVNGSWLSCLVMYIGFLYSEMSYTLNNVCVPDQACGHCRRANDESLSSCIQYDMTLMKLSEYIIYKLSEYFSVCRRQLLFIYLVSYYYYDDRILIIACRCMT